MGYNPFSNSNSRFAVISWSKVVKDRFSPVFAGALGLSVATSTAGISACSILLVLFAFLIPGFRKNLKHALQNKFVSMALIFYFIVVLGVIWSDAPGLDQIKMLMRLVGYGLTPFYFITLSQNNCSKHLLNYFIYGELLTALLSILAWIFNHPIFMGKTDTIFYWVVFRGHLLHDAFLAIASNFLLMKVFSKELPAIVKFYWFLAFVIASFDIVFLVQGRTGQVMWLISNLFLIVFYMQKKGLFLTSVLVLVLVPILINYAPAVKQGIQSYQSDQYQLSQGNNATSIGLRQEFHANSIKMFKQSPFLGHGTGSYPSHYKALIAGTGMPANTQPHGDLYLIVVELGIVGLIAFLGMLWFNFKELLAFQNKLWAGVGYALLLNYLIALTQNSFFSDNVSGLTYIFLMIAILIRGKQEIVKAKG